MNSPINQDDSSQPALSEHLMQHFIEVQSKDIDLKSKEADNERISLELNYNYALQALDKNAEYVKGLPEEKRKDKTQLFRFGVIFVFIVLIFMILAHLAGYMDQLLSILEKSLYLILGGGGGYYYGQIKNSNPSINGEVD